ncbi:hypothetical protein POM88_035536 [Heracleum sosnowskyi]|uniref:Uncharacterized protein n=1 Tax=Heracleum sosnowskyi TaxID=360622 RepID=A0AAD8HLN3_9APIA|nr:hypothetical protein POM88_035536 [Heracleum sosnowskyi]
MAFVDGSSVQADILTTNQRIISLRLQSSLAVAVVLSGCYEDGQGGNDNLGNKRQIKHQELTGGNLALKDDQLTPDCGQENTLKPGDVIQCRELYKKRTRRRLLELDDASIGHLLNHYKLVSPNCNTALRA